MLDSEPKEIRSVVWVGALQEALLYRRCEKQMEIWAVEILRCAVKCTKAFVRCKTLKWLFCTGPIFIVSCLYHLAKAFDYGRGEGASAARTPGTVRLRWASLTWNGRSCRSALPCVATFRSRTLLNTISQNPGHSMKLRKEACAG